MLEFLFDIKNIAFIVPLSGFGTDTYSVSWLELWATVLGLAAVIGARLNKVWWYPLGILNSIGFIAIFYQIQLYSDLLLNFYFIAISIFGWWVWTRRKSDGSEEYPIQYMDTNDQFLTIMSIILGTVLLGTFIDPIFNSMAQLVASVLGTTYSHTPAAMPYWDAATTVMSIAAMYLLAKRKVESWILWVIVDIICVGLYAYRGVAAMSVEYFIFLANAVYALYQWHKLATIKSDYGKLETTIVSTDSLCNRGCTLEPVPTGGGNTIEYPKSTPSPLFDKIIKDSQRRKRTESIRRNDGLRLGRDLDYDDVFTVRDALSSHHSVDSRSSSSYSPSDSGISSSTNSSSNYSSSDSSSSFGGGGCGGGGGGGDGGGGF